MNHARMGNGGIPLADAPASHEERTAGAIKKQDNGAPGIGRVGHKVIVLSGKGGVGKSTVAANMACLLARTGRQVGLLDADIHGPSIPLFLGLQGKTNAARDRVALPVPYGQHLKVMSAGFMLAGCSDAAIWRGPLKTSVIKDFIEDVLWGELDHLIIDSPPGTGDEPLTICECIPDLDGAVIITTPHQAALATVRKAIDFCQRLHIRILGVVENMSGFYCPGCKRPIQLFQGEGGEILCKETGLPLLGRIPFDPQIAAAGDAGELFALRYEDNPVAATFKMIVQRIYRLEKMASVQNRNCSRPG